MYKVEKFQFSHDRSLTFVGIRARGYGKDCYYPSSLVDIVVLTLELLLMSVQFHIVRPFKQNFLRSTFAWCCLFLTWILLKNKG